MKHPFYLSHPLLFIFAITQSIIASADVTLDLNSNHTLSATKLVSAVLQANPQLKIAQATWQASVANIKQQSALADPHFQYRFAPLTADSHTPNGQQSDFGQQFEVSQILPFPGKLHLRGLVAEYQAATQQQSISALQLQLVTSAKILFADWYFIDQAISSNQQTQALLNQLNDMALIQYSTGSINRSAILKLESELALLAHQSLILNRQQKTIQIQLNTLLNRPVNALFPKAQNLAVLKKLPNLKDLQIKAVQSRPELKVINTDLKKYKAQSELAALAYYPDLKVSAGYNSLWDNEDKRFNMGIGINIPLDQSKRQAAEQQASAYQQQAHWQKIDLEAKINQQIAEAYVLVDESLHVFNLYQQKLQPLAIDHLAAEKSDYQAGKIDIIRLMLSEKNRLDTQLKTKQALTDIHRQLAKLEQAVGHLEPFFAD